MSWFDDGKAADSTISDRFTDVETLINNVDGTMVKRGAFNEQHAASVIAGLYGASTLFLTADTGTHRYDRAVFGSPGNLDYPGFDNDTASESGVSGSPGWVVIGHSSATVTTYSSGLAKIAFSTGDGVPLTDTGPIQGVLVLFNCEIVDADDFADLEIAFCIQARIGSTWRTLAHTERAVRCENHRIDNTSTTERIIMDVPIATLVSYDVYAAEPAGVGSGLRGIRACVSLNGGDGGSWATLGRWNLTALPLRCGVS